MIPKRPSKLVDDAPPHSKITQVVSSENSTACAHFNIWRSLPRRAGQHRNDCKNEFARYLINPPLGGERFHKRLLGNVSPCADPPLSTTIVCYLPRVAIFSLLRPVNICKLRIGTMAPYLLWCTIGTDVAEGGEVRWRTMGTHVRNTVAQYDTKIADQMGVRANKPKHEVLFELLSKITQTLILPHNCFWSV